MQLTDLEQYYQDILLSLEEEKRVQLKISTSEIAEFIELWDNLLKESNWEELKKCLCLCIYSQSPQQLYHQVIFKTLESSIKHQQKEQIIFSLNAIAQHVIAKINRDGDTLTDSLISGLRLSLEYEDWEVYEWSLRLVEQLGMKSILFKDEISKRQPRTFLNFNSTQRNCLELIRLLQKRWSPLKNML